MSPHRAAVRTPKSTVPHRHPHVVREELEVAGVEEPRGKDELRRAGVRVGRTEAEREDAGWAHDGGDAVALH